MNNPLNTIFKSENKSKLKTLLETQTRPFQNNKINRIQARYQTVFSEIMSIFTESKFYHDIFLPRIKQRPKFMKINNKILGKKVEPLTQEQFEEQKKKLQINNTYDEYSSRQDIPLFIYITNNPDQFENWSAIRIFEWWRSLRMSGIPKREWPILDAVKYLFINQFMRIMNSYLKYGVDRRRNKLAFDKLQEYLRLVDVFYESGGQYQHLLNAHLAFCEWFSARFIGGLLFESGQNSREFKYVNSNVYYNKYKARIDRHKVGIIDYFNRTCEDDNFILVIPLSFFQKESKFINLYTAPLIVFLGINYRTHYSNKDFYELYSPYGQIYHDFFTHAKILIKSYNLLYTNVNKKVHDILLFKTRCNFLTLISSIQNEDIKKLLWFILHEKPEHFFSNTQFDLTTIDFFNISNLFMKLNEIINNSNSYLINVVRNYQINSIYTLIYACIIFFMFQSFSLNEISRISIEINGLIITVALNDKQLVILEINSISKQVRIIYLNKDDINQEIIDGINYIRQFGWSIVDSQQNTQKQINMYKKQIGNLYTKMLELQQSQPKL